MPEPFDPERHMRAMASALRLEIAPEHAPGVQQNLALAETLAGLVMGFPLPDEVEPAPIFEA